MGFSLVFNLSTLCSYFCLGVSVCLGLLSCLVHSSICLLRTWLRATHLRSFALPSHISFEFPLLPSLSFCFSSSSLPSCSFLTSSSSPSSPFVRSFVRATWPSSLPASPYQSFLPTPFVAFVLGRVPPFLLIFVLSSCKMFTRLLLSSLTSLPCPFPSRALLQSLHSHSHPHYSARLPSSSNF